LSHLLIELIDVEHGQQRTYMKGCRCDECRQAHRDYRRDYVARNPEKVRAYQKRYAAENADKLREKRRQFAEENPDYYKRYYLANRDAIRAAQKKWWWDNREREIQRSLEYQRQNPERVREIKRRYEQTERGQLARVLNLWRRRARIKNAPGTASIDDVKARWDFYGRLCYLCGATATEIDHVIPIARGGSNWPSNLRPACGPCNRKKSMKPLNRTRVW
jgi:5-methylcytosine-specific restriction endonuclease McrA